MNPPARYEPSKTFNHPCFDLAMMAERELSAFFNAVTQLFGPEQAQLSANDWLQELIETDALPASAREWRMITSKVIMARVSTRLASRVNASFFLTESRSSEPQIA